MDGRVRIVPWIFRSHCPMDGRVHIISVHVNVRLVIQERGPACGSRRGRRWRTASSRPSPCPPPPAAAAAAASPREPRRPPRRRRRCGWGGGGGGSTRPRTTRSTRGRSSRPRAPAPPGGWRPRTACSSSNAGPPRASSGRSRPISPRPPSFPARRAGRRGSRRWRRAARTRRTAGRAAAWASPAPAAAPTSPLFERSRAERAACGARQ